VRLCSTNNSFGLSENNSSLIVTKSERIHMDILKLIMDRKSIRKYRNKLISRNKTDKIVQAGIWGPSVFGKQPWRLIIVENKRLIKSISDLLLKESKKVGIGWKVLLKNAAGVIEKAPLIIIVYRSGSVVRIANTFGKNYSKMAKVAEVASVAAAIQNMLLVSESLGIGACWLDMPFLCRDSINKLFRTKEDLIAVLTFGYPGEKGRRSVRESLKKMITLYR